MEVIVVDCKKTIEKGNSIPLSKLDTTGLRNLILRLSCENARLEKEISALKEENEKITDIANRTSVALAELKQGISDAFDVSNAYFKD